MKVTLIDYTGKGQGEWAAADLLIYTKSTRMQMCPGLYEEISKMTEQEKLKELEYMSNTIKSSWEFCDYTFLIEGVSRAFTHQFVRNRHGSYAQQTMRVLDVSGFEYVTGPSIVNTPNDEKYADHMAYINDAYLDLIASGAKIEDARGILPTNIKTNIVAKFNLRTMSEMAEKRSSPRTQGEYRDVLHDMVDAILEVHPWCGVFLRNRKIEAAAKLDLFVADHTKSEEERREILKLIDILRG